jgi:hypothetical protein
MTNAVGVRRIASQTYAAGDVNLLRLFDMLIGDPGRLWECFLHRYPADATRVRAEVLKKQGDAFDRMGKTGLQATSEFRPKGRDFCR